MIITSITMLYIHSLIISTIYINSCTKNFNTITHLHLAQAFIQVIDFFLMIRLERQDLDRYDPGISIKNRVFSKYVGLFVCLMLNHTTKENQNFARTQAKLYSIVIGVKSDLLFRNNAFYPRFWKRFNEWNQSSFAGL